MSLITIWTVKAGDLVRDVRIADANNDGSPEVIFSSWDGRIYCVSGSTGSRIWTFKFSHNEPPAENVEILNISNNETGIVASFHNYLALIDGRNGELLWSVKSKGWISHLKVSDINGDGIDEVIILTRNGLLQGYDFQGELLLNRHINIDSYPIPMTIFDINHDTLPEIIISQGRKILTLDSKGHLLRTYNLPSKCYGLSFGSYHWETDPLLVASFPNGICLISDKKIVSKKEIRNAEPLIISSGDIDGDLLDEIIIGDWKNDSLYIFEPSEKKHTPSLKKKSSISLGDNVLEISLGDINGDGINEILLILDRIEKNMLILKENKITFSLDSYPASKGLTIGNALGHGDGDIVARIGRENVSLIVHVPRISAPRFITHQSEFPVHIISTKTSKIKLQNSPHISIPSTKLKSKTKKYSIGHVTFSTYLCKTVHEGEAHLAIMLSEKKKKILLKRPLFILSKDTIGENTIGLEICDEDVIRFKVPHSQLLSFTTKRFTTKITPCRGGNKIYLSLNSPIWLDKAKLEIKKDEKVITRDIFLLIQRALEVFLKQREFYYSIDIMEVILKNRSNLDLHVSISAYSPISLAQKIAIKLNPKKEKRLKIPFKVKKLGDYRVDISSGLIITYKGIKEHVIKVPFKATIVNVQKIKEKYSRLIDSGVPKEKAIEVIAENIRLSKEEIIKIITKTY